MHLCSNNVCVLSHKQTWASFEVLYTLTSDPRSVTVRAAETSLCSNMQIEVD